MLAPANSSSLDDNDYGSEILINDGGRELVEFDPDACLISYTLIETIHAGIYMFFAVSTLIGTVLGSCASQRAILHILVDTWKLV